MTYEHQPEDAQNVARDSPMANKINRPRSRRIFYRVGLVICALLVAAWVLSLKFTVGAEYQRLGLALDGGCFSFAVSKVPDEQSRLIYGAPWTIRWLPSFSIPERARAQISAGASVPIWCFLVLTIIPTVFFWRRSRAFPAGCCTKCGYNLTGLTEPRCPECGTRFARGESAESSESMANSESGID